MVKPWKTHISHWTLWSHRLSSWVLKHLEINSASDYLNYVSIEIIFNFAWEQELHFDENVEFILPSSKWLHWTAIYAKLKRWLRHFKNEFLPHPLLFQTFCNLFCLFVCLERKLCSTWEVKGSLTSFVWVTLLISRIHQTKSTMQK